MAYVFMSFGNIHTGKNIGCCIVQVEDFEDANDECLRLGLMPDVCNKAVGYELHPGDFENQGMELNRFYTTEEMQAMGFKKA